jgi:hypothetical protein
MSERVVPVLRLGVLCEDVVYDGDGQPFALEVPTHTLRLDRDPDGRVRLPDLKLYLQLADGVGTFYVSAELHAENGAIAHKSRPPVEVVLDGTSHRAEPLELVLDLPGIVLGGHALYELRVFCNHASLHDPRGRVPVPFPPIRLSVLPPHPTPETDHE